MHRILLGLLLLCSTARAAEGWGALENLVGTWTGEGGGQPGQGAGWFSFEADVQGKVLVRRNHSEYPSANGQPAIKHDDLMLIFREPDQNGEGTLRALYIDGEEHVIHYAVTMFGDRIVFTSDPGRWGGPQYRFTYTRVSADTLRLKFEVAAPGKSFTTYVEGSAHREPKK